LWTAVNHFREGILAWVLGDHSTETQLFYVKMALEGTFDIRVWSGSEYIDENRMRGQK
jgi:IS1 family transposase